jgi:hypothetical protein
VSNGRVRVRFEVQASPPWLVSTAATLLSPSPPRPAARPLYPPGHRFSDVPLNFLHGPVIYPSMISPCECYVCVGRRASVERAERRWWWSRWSALLWAGVFALSGLLFDVTDNFGWFFVAWAAAVMVVVRVVQFGWSGVVDG